MQLKPINKTTDTQSSHPPQIYADFSISSGWVPVSHPVADSRGARIIEMISCALWELIVIGLIALGGTAGAAENAPPPATEEGYTVVEETCYRQVTRQHCRLVPDTKSVKKTVYSYKEVPFCRTKTPTLWQLLRKDCEQCTTCEAAPHCRRVLIKHQVVEEVPTVKCIVECETENIPYLVYRRVPTASQSNSPTNQAALPE